MILEKDRFLRKIGPSLENRTNLAADQIAYDGRAAILWPVRTSN